MSDLEHDTVTLVRLPDDSGFVIDLGVPRKWERVHFTATYKVEADRAELIAVKGAYLALCETNGRLERELAGLTKFERIIQPPNEAAGCVCCDTCSGFRTPGHRCASCATVHDRLTRSEARCARLEAFIRHRAERAQDFDEWVREQEAAIATDGGDDG